MNAPHELFGMSEGRWSTLLDRIGKGHCIPIIGSQLLKGIAPRREELAASWAEEIQYPLVRTTELSMVAEFRSQYWLDKNALLTEFMEFALAEQAKIGDGWEDETSHPLRSLAELPFDTFVTTSYFDSVEAAITRFRPNAEPLSVACRWGPTDRDWFPEADVDELEPTFEKPVVFHLHGRVHDPGSLVLTESDHMAYADRLVRDLHQHQDTSSFIPAKLRNELTMSTWFFLGYGAADRNLRSLLRALGQQVTTQRAAVAVQLEKGEAIEGREAPADLFLSDYFAELLGRSVEVVLHDVRDFLAQIKVSVTAS